jgi:hypothetical protein
MNWIFYYLKWNVFEEEINKKKINDGLDCFFMNGKRFISNIKKMK